MPNDPDEPEFDWLYGGRQPADKNPGQPSSSSDAPEETRVLGKTPAPPTTPPTTRPTTPPKAPSTGRDGKKRRRFGTGRILLLLLVCWLAFLVAVPLIAWGKVEKVDATPAGARPAEQPGTTYLLVGSDSRKGLTAAQKRAMGAGGVSDTSQRTDTIMLLHTGDGPPVLLSIPRDSIVPIPGHGTTKINAAFAYGGPKLLVRTIEQSTGVRVDHFVEIGFGGFVNAVDAVGGVTICPTRRMVDRRANLNIRKGCQEVNGLVALGYARSRHTDPALGDITRAQHQREVVSAIGDEVKSPATVLNPFRYTKVINGAVSSLRVSEDTGMLDMARFAWAMTKVNGKDGLTCSMPIRDLAVHWDRQRALALLAHIKTDSTADIPKRLCRPTGLAP
ncbi:LCP family protein [Marmoricola sp. RAF53]|uniref:LCP family protein n=1 Tax=Marmoricola sp. RAF53 TaxID=3233059 RepID=UPI003F983E02